MASRVSGVKMRYLPLFHDLRDRPVLVVGGGAIATRKVELLRSTGAVVSVVAPRIESALHALVEIGAVKHKAEEFRDSHVTDQLLVIAATSDGIVNRAVSAAAKRRAIPVNVVDDPDLSSVILPAIVDRSPLVVAISSGGTAPMLARLIRERLEVVLDASLGPLAQLLARLRREVVARITDLAQRRRFYAEVLRGDALLGLRHGDSAAAERALRLVLQNIANDPPIGRVVLVGAGPGDPGLLTLHALRALQSADVVLYDRLASPEVLALARRDAELQFVGKQAGERSITQAEIHARLLAQARLGRTVVRLKGGDPYIFGRGGEECEYLRRHGVSVEVIPGITAAVGAAASAGIPLTFRGRAAALRILTAERDGDDEPTDWGSHAASRDTLAIYMGLSRFDSLGDELIRLGRAANTPFAIIENATRVEQRVLRGQLVDLAAIARGSALRSPALLIVGEVAALEELGPVPRVERSAA